MLLAARVAIFFCLPLVLAAVLSAQKTAVSQPTIWASKPDVTAFEKIENDRLAAGQRSIDNLLATKGPRTVENTLAPLDEAFHQINSAAYFAGLMEQVHPDATFRDHATAMVTKASAAQTAIALNHDVYSALAALDLSKVDSATRYYVTRQLLEFRLAGVDKDDATRARLKKLNEQSSEEQSMFDRNISDGQKTIEADPSELDGLPQDYIDRHKPGADGKIRLTTNYPDALPVFSFAKSDSLRRRMSLAFNTRAYPKNLEVLTSLMKTRYEIATLLGYPSWADYNAADKMVAKGHNIADFIQQVNDASRELSEREFKMLLAEKQKTDPGAKEIWDYERGYLSESVRRTTYNFDSQSVRPYFPFMEVKQGILDTAADLFHVSFQQEENVPSWDPAVETWIVIDSGKPIGRFYLDMHPRPGKFSHAEMAPVLDGIRGKQLPEAILVCNFPAPTATDPGLMDYGDVQTFFHEFGHLMHHILGGQQAWAGISGISMESDFVEAPSQMLEEWISSPQVLAKFARHYKTGEPIPAELVERMNRASAFGRGGWVGRQNSFSAMSYDIYKTKPENVDLDKVTLDDASHYTLFTPLPDTHQWASFGHLGGYSSAYYTYLWDKVIAEDFFLQFDHNNLLAGDAPMRYRRVVLEPGGSMSANDLVKNFLGRPQNISALQHWMAEEFDNIAGGQKSAGN
ncbi:MAG TPA: M3 family metallopeptidase [Candidatus Deferrimicrobiaceae bacterium]|jgi:thimet oligopeptidase|nr:M3 family metallopeptidase [Candidatus Deferrimicrobiaceae bacterium]